MRQGSGSELAALPCMATVDSWKVFLLGRWLRTRPAFQVEVFNVLLLVKAGGCRAGDWRLPTSYTVLPQHILEHPWTGHILCRLSSTKPAVTSLNGSRRDGAAPVVGTVPWACCLIGLTEGSIVHPKPVSGFLALSSGPHCLTPFILHPPHPRFQDCSSPCCTCIAYPWNTGA